MELKCFTAHSIYSVEKENQQAKTNTDIFFSSKNHVRQCTHKCFLISFSLAFIPTQIKLIFYLHEGFFLYYEVEADWQESFNYKKLIFKLLIIIAKSGDYNSFRRNIRYLFLKVYPHNEIADRNIIKKRLKKLLMLKTVFIELFHFCKNVQEWMQRKNCLRDDTTKCY